MDSSGLRRKIGISFLALIVAVCTVVWWGYAHLTTLLQSRLNTILGSEVKVGNVNARWNRIELDQVRIPRHGNGSFANRFSFERVVIRPSLFSLFSGRLDIKEILLEKPYLLLEIKSDGSFARVIQPRPAIPAGSSAALPLRIAAVRISNGTIDLLDWRVARKGRVGISHPGESYHLITLQNIAFTGGAVSFPLSEQPVPVRLELASKRGGHLLIDGTIAPNGLDSHLKIDLTGLNILPYRPYFIKKGDLDVSSGALTATCTLTIKKRVLDAPGILHLKELSFDHSSTKGLLLGVPAWGLVSIMSDNRNDLSVPFKVNGNLDNPRFSVQQTLLDQLATALSAKIGIPTVTGVGKGIFSFGEKGLKGIFGITDQKR